MESGYPRGPFKKVSLKIEGVQLSLWVSKHSVGLAYLTPLARKCLRWR